MDIKPFGVELWMNEFEARAADAWILCDEVYRGTNQEGSGLTPSIADIYEKGISTAGLDKFSAFLSRSAAV